MIKKEGVIIIINLLNHLSEITEKLDGATKKGDNGAALEYKREILKIKKEIDNNL